MEKPKIFQIVLLGVFAVFILIGLLAFSGKLPLPTSAGDVNYGSVTLWGTLPASVVSPVLAEKLQSEKGISIKYVEKSKETFNRDFVEALASGTGPDLFLLGQDEILHTLNKLALISYDTVSERTFKDTFVEEGEMFLRPDGIIALPFTIDPLVMYWNRDIFTNAGIIAPPSKWGEFYTLAPRVVVKSGDGTISQSLVALGEYVNVTHAKEVLSTLIMQAGNPIVVNQGGLLTTTLTTSNVITGQNPGTQAINFFTQFSKADKDSYSWNRSLPSSRTMFESGSLGTYFGFASEYGAIKQRNPHLNFDVAPIPQAEQASVRMTFGQMQGVAVVRSSRNIAGAMYGATVLVRSEVSGGVASAAGLPPVRRDLLGVRPASAVMSVFYDSAPIARAWYDPSPADTDQLFRGMIDDINSGRQKISQAVTVVQNGINGLLASYRQ
jgi:ABC-type glycerol-3-phosphate transport system substrate-binding protein